MDERDKEIAIILERLEQQASNHQDVKALLEKLDRKLDQVNETKLPDMNAAVRVLQNEITNLKERTKRDAASEGRKWGAVVSFGVTLLGGLLLFFITSGC